MADGDPSSSGIKSYKPSSTYAAILMGNKQIELKSNAAAHSSDLNSKFPAAASAHECSEIDLAALKQPDHLQGMPAIFFDLSEHSTLTSKFQFALVGKFSHGKPSWQKVMEFFDRIKLSSHCKVSIFHHKHLYIVCSNKSDFNRLWLKFVWFVDGYAMRVFKWEPSFTAHKESSIAPVWIRMEGLPLYMFDKMPLLNISNVIGKPICIDHRNLNGTMCNTAKVCIELDVTKPLVESIKIGIVQNDSKIIVEEHLVHVFYDVVPPFCQLCWHLGHGQDMCKRNKVVSLHLPQEKVHERTLGNRFNDLSSNEHHKTKQVWQQVSSRQNAGGAGKYENQHDGHVVDAADGKGTRIAAGELSFSAVQHDGAVAVDGLGSHSGNQHDGVVVAHGMGSQNVAGELLFSATPVSTVNEKVLDVATTMIGSVVDPEDGWTTVTHTKKKGVTHVINQKSSIPLKEGNTVVEQAANFDMQSEGSAAKSGKQNAIVLVVAADGKGSQNGDGELIFTATDSCTVIEKAHVQEVPVATDSHHPAEVAENMHQSNLNQAIVVFADSDMQAGIEESYKQSEATDQTTLQVTGQDLVVFAEDVLEKATTKLKKVAAISETTIQNQYVRSPADDATNGAHEEIVNSSKQHRNTPSSQEQLLKMKKELSEEGVDADLVVVAHKGTFEVAPLSMVEQIEDDRVATQEWQVVGKKNNKAQGVVTRSRTKISNTSWADKVEDKEPEHKLQPQTKAQPCNTTKLSKKQLERKMCKLGSRLNNMGARHKMRGQLEEEMDALQEEFSLIR